MFMCTEALDLLLELNHCPRTCGLTFLVRKTVSRCRRGFIGPLTHTSTLTAEQLRANSALFVTYPSPICIHFSYRIVGRSLRVTYPSGIETDDRP
jgi:hypothetical protein